MSEQQWFAPSTPGRCASCRQRHPKDRDGNVSACEAKHPTRGSVFLCGQCARFFSEVTQGPERIKRVASTIVLSVAESDPGDPSVDLIISHDELRRIVEIALDPDHA